MEVSLVAAEQKREAKEAEFKQAITEMRFELRRLQDSRLCAVQAMNQRCES